jgi:hypothetical protein
VRGSREAIASTQLSPVHFYQRPDDGVSFDSTRTSLAGIGSGIGFSKSGGILRFYFGAWHKSAGLEINDVGFMTNVNQLGESNWVAFVLQQPKWFYRRWQVNFNQWNNYLTNGLLTGRGGNVNMNSGGAHCLKYGVTANNLLGVKLVTIEGEVIEIGGTYLDAVYPSLDMSFSRRDGGRSLTTNIGPAINARIASAFSTTVGLSFNRNRDDRQWIGNYGDVMNDTTHYTIGHLNQKTISLTTRINWTASPTLSLQVYAQPFVTGGE